MKKCSQQYQVSFIQQRKLPTLQRIARDQEKINEPPPEFITSTPKARSPKTDRIQMKNKSYIGTLFSTDFKLQSPVANKHRKVISLGQKFPTKGIYQNHKSQDRLFTQIDSKPAAIKKGFDLDIQLTRTIKNSSANINFLSSQNIDQDFLSPKTSMDKQFFNFPTTRERVPSIDNNNFRQFCTENQERRTSISKIGLLSPRQSKFKSFIISTIENTLEKGYLNQEQMKSMLSSKRSTLIFEIDQNKSPKISKSPQIVPQKRESIFNFQNEFNSRLFI